MRCVGEALAARAAAAVPGRRRCCCSPVTGCCIPSSPARPDDNRIELTADDLRQLEVAWTAQWRRPPTPDEMRGLIERASPRGDPLSRSARPRPRPGRHHRQAQAGAENGIPRRRCLGAARSYRATNCVRGTQGTPNALPSLAAGRSDTCTSLPDRRGDQARAGRRACAAPSWPDKPADAPTVGTIGDPFMFQDHYADRSPEQIASIIRKRVRCCGRSGPIRVLARTDRVGPGLASRVRDLRDARARALLRRDRTGDQGGMDR